MAAGLVACSEESSAHEIESGQVVTDPDVAFHETSTMNRLGVRMPGATTPGTGMDSMEAGSVAPAVDPSRPSPLTWSTPAGWTEVAPTSMRLANFLGGDPEVQCYVTILTGDGGGMLANVNRWREQMGVPPVDSATLDAMPRVPQLGVDAVLVEVGAGEQGLIGTVSLHGAQSVFVKMIGPKDLVFAAKPGFLALCESLAFQG